MTKTTSLPLMHPSCLPICLPLLALSPPLLQQSIVAQLGPLLHHPLCLWGNRLLEFKHCPPQVPNCLPLVTLLLSSLILYRTTPSILSSISMILPGLLSYILTLLSQTGQNGAAILDYYASDKDLEYGLRACLPLLIQFLILMAIVSGPSMMTLSRLSFCNMSASKTTKTYTTSPAPMQCFWNYANIMRSWAVICRSCLWRRLSEWNLHQALVFAKLGMNWILL